MSTTAKADWKMCINGSDDYGFEIAICRESFSHGFRSWGWDGEDEKIILFEMNFDETPKPLREVLLRFKKGPLMEFAQAAADAMNHVEQQSLLR